MAEILSRSESCSIGVEDVFGPRVVGCLGGFDFTLLFQESILCIPLLGLLMLATPPRILRLYRNQVKVYGGPLYILKLIGMAILLVLQIVLLVLWTRPSTPKTRLTLASAALACASTLSFCFLSHLEHLRSVRPSSILSIYLLLSTLLDSARARTLWAIEDNRVVAIIFITTVGLRVPLLIMESMGKRLLLKEPYQQSSAESTSGIISQSLFWWLNPLLRLGYNKLLLMEDLFTLDKVFSAAETENSGLQRVWNGISKERTKHALLFASIQYYKWPLLAGVIPRACQVGFVFAQPFLVDTTVEYVSRQDDDPNLKNYGYGLIAAYGFVYVGIAVSTTVAQHKAYRLITMMRGALVDMIYRKTMIIMATNIEESAPVTLMSADIERLGSGLRYIYDSWACVVEIPIALYLLWQQLGIASIAPIGVAIVCMISAVLISALAGQRQKVWLESIQKRVDATANMLGSMKGVKMTGLTDKLFKTIQNLREEEISKSQKFRELLILVVGLAYTNVAISPVISFTIYSLLARRDGTEALTTAKAFTSLTLFTLLATPIGNLVESAAGLASALSSLERINQFLLGDSRQDTRGCGLSFIGESKFENSDRALQQPLAELEGHETPDSVEMNSLKRDSIDALHMSMVARNRSAGWDKEKPSVVEDLTFKIQNSTLTIIIGPVGCGKSTFLTALLGETQTSNGYLGVNPVNIAYCSQTPWLANKTVQENILGESVFDVEWYNAVIRACALDQDIKLFPLGDQTMLGSKGAVLSGGQKQRLSLARAVYSKMDTIILDDVLSGLDPTTEDHVFTALLGDRGIFRQRLSTVILTTNSLHRLPYADHIIAIGPDGHIAEQGSFHELNSRAGYVQSLSIQQQSPSSVKKDNGVLTNLPLSSSVIQLPEAEGDRRTGDLTVYFYYFKTIGLSRSLIFVLLIATYVFFLAFPVIWVQWWAAANDYALASGLDANVKLGWYLGIYGFLAAMAVVFIVFSCWHLMANVVSQSARIFHKNLLMTVLSAPMSFFSVTDVGVTTNRFSQDLQLIDMELPLALLNTVLSCLTCLAQLIVISYSTKYVAASIPLCIVVFYFIQRYYLRTSRQLRFMDIEAKSPLFSNFLETLSGLITIRSYGWEEQYRTRNSELVENSQRPFYLLYCIQRWLELVVGMSVAGFAALLVGVAVATRGQVSGGFIGVALVNVVTFSENLQGLIMHWTVLETSIGAVSRIRNFVGTTESENLPTEKDTPPDNWPKDGEIEFKEVSASYKANADPVLKGISFSITSGQKVGICGRTGSGKSSLVSTLFRTLDLTSGSIIIDGLDISTLPRQEIRSRLIVIPQEPYLFAGSVRLNVDPSESLSDEDIKEALKKVQLWDVIADQGGLDATVTNEFLSHGQKQLLCLAAAILRKGSILVLDEATSSVDTQTDAVMQSLIRSEFASHTIIAIAHRLETILDFDQVLVIDKGAIKESGNPKELVGTESAFRTLYMDSCHSSVEGLLKKYREDGAREIGDAGVDEDENEKLELLAKNISRFSFTTEQWKQVKGKVSI